MKANKVTRYYLKSKAMDFENALENACKAYSNEHFDYARLALDFAMRTTLDRIESFKRDCQIA
mgnify:CR=1 FL=1